MSIVNNARSPLYIKVIDEDATYNIGDVTIEIKMTNGNVSSMGNVLYTLTKNASGASYVVFEIAELLRDYIETENDGTYLPSATNGMSPLWYQVTATATDATTPTQAVDVKIDGEPDGTSDHIKTDLIFDGYSYFEEGINKNTTNKAFLSTNTVYVPSGQSLRIPVNVEECDTASGGWSWKYYEVGSSADEDGATFSTSLFAYNKLKYITVTSAWQKIELYSNPQSSGFPSLLHTVYIEEMDCNKYDPIKVTFYNKYGALQDLFFTAKHTEALTTKSEDYKSNLIDFSTMSYSTTRHQSQTFHKQGKERITLNTGNVNEDYNEAMKELMLSEKVWMTKDSTIYPIKVTSSNFIERTSVNDKVFNYTIEAEYAFDKVQNIR